MDLSVEAIGIEELKGGNPFQTPFWAQLKRLNHWSGSAFRVSCASFDGTVLVLTRRICRLFTLAYIPFGFSEAFTSDDLISFARALSPLLPDDTLLLRTDVAWGCLLEDSPLLHSCRSSVQPEGTVRIDLSGELDFRQRVGRNLRKEAAVVVRPWQGDEQEFHAWYETYVHTSLRDHFSTRSESYIRSLFDISDPSVKPVLYLAWSDGQISGGILNLRTADEELYLFGSSVKHTGNISCGYSLQSHAILEARAAGVGTYDMFGIDGMGGEGHLASLTTFKTAFGGSRVYRSPTVDFIYRPLAGRIFRMADSLRFSLARRSRI